MLVGLPPGNEFDGGSSRAARASFGLCGSLVSAVIEFGRGQSDDEEHRRCDERGKRQDAISRRLLFRFDERAT
jgi:hypothetical protein